MDSIPPIQCCTKCGIEYPLTSVFFQPDKSGYRFGFNTQCRKCLNARNKTWKQSNPEKVRATSKKRYDKDPEKQKRKSRDYRNTPHGKSISAAANKQWRLNNPEKVKATKKRDYEKHKDKRLATMQKNYLKNKPAIMARGKEWKKRNPEKVKADTLKRIIRKRNLPMDYYSKDWIVALEYFSHQCAVCGYDCSNQNDNRVLAQDHWIPMEYKGADNPGTVPTNIVPLCHGTGGCNNLKHDFMPDVYLAKYFDDHAAQEIRERIATYFEWVKTSR